MRRLLAHCVGLPVAFALGCQDPVGPEPISFSSIRYESYRPISGGVDGESQDDAREDEDDRIADADVSDACNGSFMGEDASLPDSDERDVGEGQHDAGDDDGTDGGAEEEPRELPGANETQGWIGAGVLPPEETW
jgi:hypothetical protein